MIKSVTGGRAAPIKQNYETLPKHLNIRVAISSKVLMHLKVKKKLVEVIRFLEIVSLIVFPIVIVDECDEWRVLSECFIKQR